MLGQSKNKRRALDTAKKFFTRIGNECVFEGILSGGDHCTVEGKVIGECNISGILCLEANGSWQGNIAADVVVIAGTVDGNVTAHSKIELRQSSRVVGNLKAPSIAIAEGSTFDGEINMTNPENITRFKERRGADKKEYS
jgi:cytoskeletal protein CcmA (bactofilin family)